MVRHDEIPKWALDKHLSLPDYFLAEDGDTLSILFDKLYSVLPLDCNMVNIEFDIISSIDKIMRSHSVIDLLTQPNIIRDNFPVLAITRDLKLSNQDIETIIYFAERFLELIVLVISSNKLYITNTHPLGHCYRIGRRDGHGMVLNKFSPWSQFYAEFAKDLVAPTRSV